MKAQNIIYENKRNNVFAIQNPNWPELMSSGTGEIQNINTLVGLLSRLTNMKSVKP